MIFTEKQLRCVNMNDNSTKRVLINQDHNDIDLLWPLITSAVHKCYSNPNTVLTIVIPDKRFNNVIEYVLYQVLSFARILSKAAINTRDDIYKFYNGSLIHVLIPDCDLQNLRMGKRDYLLIWQPNKLSFEAYHHLYVRTRYLVYLLFRDAPHWLEMDSADAEVITY